MYTYIYICKYKNTCIYIYTYIQLYIYVCMYAIYIYYNTQMMDIHKWLHRYWPTYRVLVL